jgi:hypothetical protein
MLFVIISAGLQEHFVLGHLQSYDKPKNAQLEHKISKLDTVVVYPIFTQAAYGNNGFYDYYRELCDSKCLTVTIPSSISGSYVSSGMGFVMLSSLNFDTITDIDVDKNPNILKQYKRIVILHNEYVTKKEFDAITSHSNVIYLYPNALYAEVKTDYEKNHITLVRGHNYPAKNVINGFGWKFDNSKMEYDTTCKNLSYYKVANGMMLNCYPEMVIYNKSILKSLVQQ